MILHVFLCNVCLIYVSYYDLYICAHMTTCLTLCEYKYTGGNPPPCPLRSYEHLTASYLILPSHRHRQALGRMRHLHWHSLVRSRVLRHRIRQCPLWTSYLSTSYCFTKNPYPTLNRHVKTLWSPLQKPLSHSFGTKRAAEA